MLVDLGDFRGCIQGGVQGAEGGCLQAFPCGGGELADEAFQQGDGEVFFFHRDHVFGIAVLGDFELLRAGEATAGGGLQEGVEGDAGGVLDGGFQRQGGGGVERAEAAQGGLAGGEDAGWVRCELEGFSGFLDEGSQVAGGL